MDNMIGSLNKMLENRAEAIQVLNANLDEFDTARSMVKMMEAGFLEKKDPHLINLVNMFRVNLLKDLKKKAKIHVPKGAFLLGVMDETGSLQEGEVFCQVSEIAGGRRKVITGECVLFRNPCFHPGDIRVVRAVDSHKLRDLCDVIVFSAQGYRDIPSMCSGGDLDGDDYTVFWDPDLMPTIKNYEPMDYQAEEPLEVDEVKISHIQKFFVNYINNDNLGQIANAHLATADRSSRGALDGACLRLAQLHSLAVDFPKTGKPARLDDDLRVRAFPDFMQKKDKQMYESKKVLGRIYRSIDKADYKDYKSKLTNESDYDVRLRAPGMERYIADARHWRYCYNRDLLALMNQYGVSTEAEIVSGYIIKWSKKGNRKSLHELQKTTMTAVTSMRNSYRHEFQREFSLKNGSVGAELQADVDAKAAAWYYVTYHPNERRRDYSFEGGFFSFPWVVYDYLCDLARKNGHRVPAEDQAQPVDDAVIEAMQKKYARDKSPIQLSVHVSDSEDNEEEEDDDDETNASAEESDEEEEEVVEIVPSTMISLNSSVRKATTNNTETGSIKSPSLSDTQKPAFIPHAPTHINNDKQAHLDVDATEADLEKALLN
ncbi:RNA dependent RNA polymerase-domain-containing protein [Radiomyces spectabilis]|uniref:RNA dependent RNA polymerase-domain-containing protein n=1 Tax=Radiomyces spectabilis TaxID=64574 RepID=UPI00221E965A|nr:RNA dependent RNA polymerase-domain-containing protein [Radiomyces spectabilis]KAI8388533.1 RNA dependent RNA polymerase-domain-containing protein [Radiomyces spectabilis]